MNDQTWMQQAIDEARRADDPFGSVIVRDGAVLASEPNRVDSTNDPTAHAEVCAIRKAAPGGGRNTLAGATLYTTCEPCPMCAAACVWAGIDRIVFGASIDEIKQYWHQIDIPCSEVIARGFHPIEITGGVLREQCLSLYID